MDQQTDMDEFKPIQLLPAVRMSLGIFLFYCCFMAMYHLCIRWVFQLHMYTHKHYEEHHQIILQI